ncbi:TetR family transcriptional regulator [Arcicella aurantiaca]|uniref:TetR family transcriptional regulator n=1 Tax=Arcicella aurantiaca TaxID=591202 RepID=A0A316EBP4_9BACT|nr:TetR/AcrR family transcriptional regulator [Arcicella aurantiaca]PWK26743.1 TetR family transcriptional regulator [Arcicella aurantiaca]
MPIQKVTKEEILTKSLEVFRHRGYHNTSMNDLAHAVGLLKGSFYHYFDSKETLMKEVLMSVNILLQEEVFPIAYNSNLPIQERMETMLKRFSKTVFNKEGGCIVGNTILETVNLYPQFKEVLQEILTGWTNALTHLYSYTHAPENAKKLAEQSIMEYEGAIMMAKLYGESYYYKDCYIRTMERLKA